MTEVHPVILDALATRQDLRILELRCERDGEYHFRVDAKVHLGKLGVRVTGSGNDVPQAVNRALSKACIKFGLLAPDWEYGDEIGL